MELLGGGAKHGMVYVPAVHATSHKRVCADRAAFSCRLSECVGNAKKICLVWGLLLVASHKADIGWPLLPRLVINSAHGGRTERTPVFIRGI